MPDLEARILALRARIDAALARSPRGDRPVTLIAVSKHHPAASVDEVVRAGLVDVGENRVQEAVAKAAEVSTRPRWHLIGHLQRNKVARAAALFDTIHSVDSMRLLEALERTGREIGIFLQVNVSGERSKSGASPDGVRDLLRRCYAAESIVPLGLMTMAPHSDDPEDARPHFRTLYELRADLERFGDGPPLPALSMGMSGDFEVAIEEGATHIRIGTAIFGERSPTGG